MTRRPRKRALKPGVAALVRQAGPLARSIVMAEGVAGGSDDGDLYGDIEEHVGVGPIAVKDEDFPAVIDLTIGAYAIGIAVGLLLRAEAFADVGALGLASPISGRRLARPRRSRAVHP